VKVELSLKLLSITIRDILIKIYWEIMVFHDERVKKLNSCIREPTCSSYLIKQTSNKAMKVSLPSNVLPY